MGKKLTPIKINAWATLIRAQQHLRDQVEFDLKQAGLPPLSWYDVLLELKRAPEGRLRLNEIGAHILLEKSNVTRLIDRLEKEGLLNREHCKDDKRGAFAVITEQGRALQKRMWPIYAKAIETHFAAKLTINQCNQLLAWMQILINR